MGYSKEVLDHFMNPLNVGNLNEAASDTGVGIVGAPSCGDVLKLSIQVVDGTIVDAKFKAFGCGSAIASSSYLTQIIIGKKLEEIQQIDNKTIAQKLMLPPIKYHCSVLAKEAVTEAIKNYQSKNNGKNTMEKNS